MTNAERCWPRSRRTPRTANSFHGAFLSNLAPREPDDRYFGVLLTDWYGADDLAALQAAMERDFMPAVRALNGTDGSGLRSLLDRNFARLLDTLAVLQRRSALTTQQVCRALEARGHAAGVRTVQRDLEALAITYPLLRDQRVRPYTWMWDKSAPRITIPGVDWPEAIAFHMLAKYLDALLPASVSDSLAPCVQEADRRLAAHFDQLPLRRWPERVRMIAPGQTFLGPTVKKSVHIVFTEAVLLAGRCVRISYRAFDQAQPKPYRVSPWASSSTAARSMHPYASKATTMSERWRSIGCCVQRLATKRRASSASTSMTGSAPVASDSVAARPIVLVLRMYDNTAQLLAEAPLSLDQAMEPATTRDSQVVRASVLDTEQLRRWILGMGSRVEVLEPAALRAQLAGEARKAARRYRAT